MKTYIFGPKKTFSAQKFFSDLKNRLFDQKMTFFDQKTQFLSNKILFLTKNNFADQKHTTFIQKIPFLNAESTFFDKEKYLVGTRKAESAAESVVKTNTSLSTHSISPRSAWYGI